MKVDIELLRQFDMAGIQYARVLELPDSLTLENRRKWLEKTLSYWHKRGDIPDAAELFLDFYPSIELDHLLEGDIVLKKPTHPTATQKAIQFAQSQVSYKNNVDDHHLYTHVFISRGGYEIYESEPKEGVHRDGIWNALEPDSSFKILRLKNEGEYNRRQVVYNVAEQNRMSYDVRGAAVSCINVLNRFFPFRRRDDEDNTFFCSALIAAACYYEGIDLKLGIEAEGELDQKNPRFITPAELSASDAFEEVKIDMLKIDDYIDR